MKNKSNACRSSSAAACLVFVIVNTAVSAIGPSNWAIREVRGREEIRSEWRLGSHSFVIIMCDFEVRPSGNILQTYHLIDRVATIARSYSRTIDERKSIDEKIDRRDFGKAISLWVVRLTGVLFVTFDPHYTRVICRSPWKSSIKRERNLSNWVCLAVSSDSMFDLILSDQPLITQVMYAVCTSPV